MEKAKNFIARPWRYLQVTTSSVVLLLSSISCDQRLNHSELSAVHINHKLYRAEYDVFYDPNASLYMFRLCKNPVTTGADGHCEPDNSNRDEGVDPALKQGMNLDEFTKVLTKGIANYISKPRVSDLVWDSGAKIVMS